MIICFGGVVQRCFVTLPTCYFANVPFGLTFHFFLIAISSTCQCSISSAIFDQFYLVSTCHFVNLPFAYSQVPQLEISSICHFVLFEFHQRAIFSTGNLINLPFFELAILTIFNAHLSVNCIQCGIPWLSLAKQNAIMLSRCKQSLKTVYFQRESVRLYAGNNH